MKETQSLPLGRSAHRDMTLRQSRNVRPFGGKFQIDICGVQNQDGLLPTRGMGESFVENGPEGGRTVLCVTFNTMTCREQALKKFRQR